MWVFMARISGNDNISTWISGDFEDIEKTSNGELYMAAFYYIVTTLTTVGYGDIYPTKATDHVNSIELIYGSFMMVGGVTVYALGSA